MSMASRAPAYRKSMLSLMVYRAAAQPSHGKDSSLFGGPHQHVCGTCISCFWHLIFICSMSPPVHWLRSDLDHVGFSFCPSRTIPCRPSWTMSRSGESNGLKSAKGEIARPHQAERGEERGDRKPPNFECQEAFCFDNGPTWPSVEEVQQRLMNKPAATSLRT